MPIDNLPLSDRTTDEWTWVARYADGGCLAEYGLDGDHGFAEIDLTQLRIFELQAVDLTSGRSSFAVLIDPSKNQRPIFFRRRASEWLLAGGEVSTLLTCIGRQETIHVGCDVCRAASDEPCKRDCAAFLAKTARRHINVSTYVFFDDFGHVVIADGPDP